MRPDGAIVSIYVDLVHQVFEGDLIVTTTGRRYLVIAARYQRSGRHRRRQHLRCIVNGASEPAPGRSSHTIRWYSRNPRKK